VKKELLRLEPVSLMIKKSRLRWFGQVERKDDNDWVKRCITWEVEGIKQRGRPKKTWWDCVKNDMESLGLSQKDVQFRNKWRRRIEGQLANPGLPGKWPLKWSVCAVEISKFCRCRERKRERERERERERDVEQSPFTVVDIGLCGRRPPLLSKAPRISS